MKLDDLKSRYSVKKFDPTLKVEDEKLEVIMSAFHLCPSSINLQAWKLFVVKNQDVKEQLSVAGQDTNSDRIKECSHFLVLTRKSVGLKHFERVIDNTDMLKILIEKKNLTQKKLSWFFWFYSKFMGGKHWVTYQVYIALGFLMATCASLGVGALPMEGIRRGKIDSILGIGGEYKTVVALAIGYPHKDDENNPSKLKKSRFPFSEVVEVI